MELVFFWTDILLWALIVCLCISGLAMRKQAQWLHGWQQVLHNKRGVVTGLILLTFVVIGLLDSIHFTSLKHISPISVLDYILWPIGQSYEETYSAPFSLHLFIKKMQMSPEGQAFFSYPSLNWIDPTITNNADRWQDIEVILFYAFLKAFVVWIAIIGLLFIYQYWRLGSAAAACRLLSSNPSHTLPWRALLLTLAIITLILLTCKDLSLHYHIMGTDKIGTDVFYQGVKSIRTGLIIGTVTSLFMLPVALLFGMLAGYFRGWVDDIIQYIYSTLNAIPSVLLIAAAALVLQLYILQHADWFPTVEQRADARLLLLCIVLGLTNWTTLCRLLRGETLKLRETEYVLAARALGVPHLLILWRHIMPNVLPLVLVIVVLDFSGFVLVEAVLSYVGVGVDTTTNSWGNMINQARLELAREPMVWWSLATAFVLMSILVLSANLFADKVRDAFDPRLQQI